MCTTKIKAALYISRYNNNRYHKFLFFYITIMFPIYMNFNHVFSVGNKVAHRTFYNSFTAITFVFFMAFEAVLPKKRFTTLALVTT